MADENIENETVQEISDSKELTDEERARQFEIVKSALSRAS